MMKARFTASQIMDALKRVEAGLAVPDRCREPGFSTATFYKWLAKYGGMDVSPITRSGRTSCTTDRPTDAASGRST